jgi:hypothetical protein
MAMKNSFSLFKIKTTSTTNKKRKLNEGSVIVLDAERDEDEDDDYSSDTETDSEQSSGDETAKLIKGKKKRNKHTQQFRTSWTKLPAFKDWLRKDKNNNAQCSCSYCPGAIIQ